ncbi:cytochrome P450 306a1 isoform X2 [Photinus pyralis]|uniref:cytochrome P450 306a1 isoform X2 n=1 Tax=Photinus pyralis TaxID=7054 RepID=UPI001266FF84|nr:cytochrome P450 306a1 isoform X2 [Photinus pyralis]
MMIYILIFAILLLLGMYRLLRSKNLPPGPWGLPVLGYLPFLDPKAPHETLTTLSRKYGKIYGLHLGSVYTIVLSDATAISSAFSMDKLTGRAPLYLTHGIMGGYGLICAEGSMWRIHRKFAAKFLRLFGATKSARAATDSLTEVIIREVHDCVNVSHQLATPAYRFLLQVIGDECEPIDPLAHLQHAIGSVMCQLVFGKTWSRDDPTWLWLQHTQEEGTKAIGVAGPLNFFPFLRYIPRFSKVVRFLLDGKHKTHQLYRELIEQERKNVQADESPQNVIQAFLREINTTSDKEYFTFQQFYHLLADIFGAGLDTTLTTLRWQLLYMAACPKIQGEIREEVDRVLQDRPPTIEDIPLLPLTRASIAETQRIRSVVPVGIPHATLDEVNLLGYRIPKGTMVVPLQWAVHMDPTIWEKPDEFNPRRFLNEEQRFAKPKQFMPFQTGKRMCIGEDLAIMILFFFTASILQRFEICASGDVDLVGEIGITLTPRKQAIRFVSRR